MRVGTEIMNMQNTQAEQHLDFQDEEISQSLDSPASDLSASSPIRPQTSTFRSLLLTHQETSNQPLASDLYIFSMDRVKDELDEIREEVKEISGTTEDIIVVPEPAYNETFSLLEELHHDVPMPDIMWLENGGIGLEWRPRDGIATMSLYGDGLVIYGVFFSKSREISGICSLDDSAFLRGFLTTLIRLFW